MTLRMLPGPFAGWLGVLMFLLVMQFLIMYLKDMVGKGLPVGIILELVVYNLAYMLVLAVPMAALIAVLTTFGRLAESGAYAVLKSAGIAYQQIVWPVVVVGAMLVAAMVHFNGAVLPEANYRARALWSDIRSARPGFALKPGVFYGGLDGYRILVRELPVDDPSSLVDVLIYDYTDGNRFRSDIKARRGTLRVLANGRYLEIELEDGEIHRRRPQTETGSDRYERYTFARHRLVIAADEFDFRRSDPSDLRRTDRTMSAGLLGYLADSLDASVRNERASIDTLVATIASRRTLVSLPSVPDPSVSSPDDGGAIEMVDPETPRVVPASSSRIREAALDDARLMRTRLENARRTIDVSGSQADRYRVELYKKYSLAVACLVFLLIGAPLGLRVRRGSIAATAVVALGVFMLYWVGLVIGEKQADRGYLAPWLGMWSPNILGAFIAVWLNASAVLDRKTTGSPGARLLRALARRRNPVAAHG